MAEVGPAEFVRRLVTGGAIEGVRGPVSRKADPSAPRVAYLRELAPRLVSEFLAKSGGWRKRDVVAGGRELRDQRIWSKDVWDRVDFKLSQPSWELMARAVEWRAGAGAAPGAPLDASVVQGLRPATMGDIVWFHLMIDPLVGSAMRDPSAGDAQLDGLDGDGEGEEDDDEGDVPRRRREARRKGRGSKPSRPSGQADEGGADAGAAAAVAALLEASPLTALFRGDAFRVDYADGHAGSRAWEATVERAGKRLAPLVAKERAVVLTYLDDAVARAWLEAEPARRAAGLDEARMRYASLAATIQGLLHASEDAKRLDANRPSLRFFERYVVRVGRHGIATFFQERAAELSQPHVGRQSYTRCVSLLFGAAGALADAADDVEGEAYVNRSVAEKAFLKAFQGDGLDLEGRGLDDLVDDYEEVRRVLADEIGDA